MEMVLVGGQVLYRGREQRGSSQSWTGGAQAISPELYRAVSLQRIGDEALKS